MNITLGQKVRELRNSHDLSLRELADTTGVSAAFLSDIELGKRFPSDEVLAAIAKALRVSEKVLQSVDQRNPSDAIRLRISKDPEFGVLLRRVVQDMSTEDIKKKLLGRKKS